MGELIKGVALTPLRIIDGEKGRVMHALKATDDLFSGFGEAYFSSVKTGRIKGWKCHSKMIMNLVVPVGSVRFVIYDDRLGSPTRNVFNEFILGPDDDYARLTVANDLWAAFQGIGPDLNLLLNLASVPHDPAEVQSLPIVNDRIPNYAW